MLNVIYSDEVKWKLKLLKEKLVLFQSEKKVTKTIGGIVSVLDSLGEFPDRGVAIKAKYDIECPDNWYLLYCNKNYFIYSLTDTKVNVIEMYDNRQDFIHELFGVDMRSSESIQFWGE